MINLKHHFLTALFFGASLTTFAQVGIGTTSPQGVLDVVSTDSGFVIPRVATITDVTTPINGTLAYAIDQKCFKGYQEGAWADLTVCSPVTTAMTFNSINAYNGVSVIDATGIGYNDEAVPAGSTIAINVTNTAQTPYSFTATDATTGLIYSASGQFTTTGAQVVTLTNNGVTVPEFSSGVINLILTGASNTLALAPRIDIKSIPASETAVVDVTYGTQTWMDRNLGARRAATTINDIFAHGNYYQWGRPADGHEIPVWHGTLMNYGRTLNSYTTTLATTDTPAHNNFIETAVAADWRSDNNNNRWATANQGPCPEGYHVPTEAEWTTADTFGGWTHHTDLYNSALKLSLSGQHYFASSVGIHREGERAIYWSSSVRGIEAFYISASENNIGLYSRERAYGTPVRCLKN